MGSASRNGLFFESTKQGFAQIEAAHDFFWCAAVAIWNTRADLAGLRHVAPDISQEDLASRFAAGSGLSGSNVVTSMDGQSWADQMDEIASLRLVVVFAHFEGWLEAVSGQLGLDLQRRRTWSGQMAVPNKWKSAVASLGTSEPLRQLVARSPMHGYDLQGQLHEAIVCLRYFKEVRNCVAHNGGGATQRLLDSQADYATVVSGGSLGSVYEPPVFRPVVSLGEPVAADHHGVVGFTGLLQRIMATLDSLLLQTAAAEQSYLEGWAEANGRRRQLPAGGDRRTATLRKLAGRVGPKPTAVPAPLEALLKGAGAIT
ncbi:MAG TPA: hypothetical protein PKE05_04920 [Microthrixaceae bacterium]|nr:hypothetical protein [Microthrixaceae bacterium]